MQQLMLPLLLAMDATKKGLLSFVQQMGMVALAELLATEAAMIAGPKGKHIDGRTHHHWGTATTPVCFGGRNVSLPHPRVRVRGQGRGAEVTLPSVEALRDGDPMSERVVEQIALGVSTRGYDRSLEAVDESIETRGGSKSNASRALIEATTEARPVRLAARVPLRALSPRAARRACRRTLRCAYGRTGPATTPCWPPRRRVQCRGMSRARRNRKA